MIPSSDSFGGSTMTPPPPPPSVKGVHDLRKTVSTAQDASREPNPQSEFHLFDTLGSDGLPFCSLELRSISLISTGVRLESA